MITQRFRPLVWVVGVAFAATGLYTVSLGVASERAQLEDLNKKIADTRREIRQLQTELGTRGSLRQLERWNGEAVALVAPSAKQYLNGDSQLSLVKGENFAGSSYVSAPVMVAAQSEDAQSETAQVDEAESEAPLVKRPAAGADRETAKLETKRVPKATVNQANDVKEQSRP